MITYLLAPSPKWYFFDSFGRLAAGGSITTRSSLDHTTPKFVYSDAAGLHPITDPIILDATGGSPVPMYWQINGVDLYYVVVRDAVGNIIFEIDNFPFVGGGGVTPITTITDIENHLVNGQFLFIDAVNEADSVISPAPIGDTHLAPGSGFFKNIVGEYVPVAVSGAQSGWSFRKAGGVGAIDAIRFVNVTGIGENNPNAPSANATRYFEYQLSGIGAAITEASLNNIIPNVQLFQNETLTISFDTNSNVAGNGTFQIEQNFGTGGAPSPPVPPTTHGFAFANTGWARQSFTFNVPSVVGKNRGTNLDDHLRISWLFPLGVIGSFRLANLQVQRGVFGVTPYIEQTYAQDQYKILVDLMTRGNILFQTGDYQWSDNVVARTGWLIIFNSAQFLGKTAASAASSFGLQYQNLYVLWWTIYPQTECIVNGGRGVSALADFNADKRMSIPQHLVNYVFGVVGNSIGPVGVFEGERVHQLTIPELPSHNHTTSASGTPVASGSGGTASPLFAGGSLTGATGGNIPHNNMQPTTYKFLFVKL
jgi:microcystin-dependent protein